MQHNRVCVLNPTLGLSTSRYRQVAICVHWAFTGTVFLTCSPLAPLKLGKWQAFSIFRLLEVQSSWSWCCLTQVSFIVREPISPWWLYRSVSTGKATQCVLFVENISDSLQASRLPSRLASHRLNSPFVRLHRQRADSPRNSVGHNMLYTEYYQPPAGRFPRPFLSGILTATIHSY